jgi:hypothetical protein
MIATATVAIAVAAGAFGGVLSFWGMFAFVEWVFARRIGNGAGCRRARSGRVAIASITIRWDDHFTSSGFSSSRSIKRNSLAVGSGTGRVPAA